MIMPISHDFPKIVDFQPLESINLVRLAGGGGGDDQAAHKTRQGVFGLTGRALFALGTSKKRKYGIKERFCDNLAR